MTRVVVVHALHYRRAPTSPAFSRAERGDVLDLDLDDTAHASHLAAGRVALPDDAPAAIAAAEHEEAEQRERAHEIRAGRRRWVEAWSLAGEPLEGEPVLWRGGFRT